MHSTSSRSRTVTRYQPLPDLRRGHRPHAERDADQPLDSVADLLKDFAGHLLWTARGNSGVILSQVVRGLAEGVDGCTVIDAGDLAAGLTRADERAWQGVTDPKEGTMLSVSRAAALASAEARGLGFHAATVRILEAAQEALAGHRNSCRSWPVRVSSTLAEPDWSSSSSASSDSPPGMTAESSSGCPRPTGAVGSTPRPEPSS